MNVESGILAIVFGYIAQWLRGFSRIPNQWSYVFIGAGGVLVYWLAMGGDPLSRGFWWSAFTWMLTARGTASTLDHAEIGGFRLAPRTDSVGMPPKGS